MGHRNLIGWRRDGKVTGSYSQWGGYYDGIPVTIQDELREELGKIAGDTADALWPHLAERVDKMRLVPAGDFPDEKDRAKYAASHQNVSTGADWYAYLRDHQGSLMKRLEAGIMTDDSDFVEDSLYCEYAVILDFDNREVVLLEGFNTDPDKEWEGCRVDVSAWKPRFEGDRLDYFGCSLHWKGTMQEFLELDIERALEPEDEDA